MKKEDLVAKGLTEEQAQSVIDIYTEEMKSFIPKHRFDELNDSNKDLKTQLADRDKQLTDLQKAAGDNEGLKKQITALQETNKKEKEAYDARILTMEKNTAVKEALTGAVHPELLIGQFDMEKVIKNADGTFSGITEQIEAQKKAFPDMFKTGVSGKTPPQGRQSAGGSNDKSREDLQKIIDDPSAKFIDRIAARNKLYELEREE